ncbi:MAG: hypothetical protein K2H07_08745, partial [Lachnospiraceae bacterium]|nr:hypothetical protein [Lachnospiraceae bacterium]
DLFGEGRHIYTFENRCIQNTNLVLGDETVKIILNTKGTMKDVSTEMKNLLDYIDGQESSDDFTKELDTAVRDVKNKEKWRVEYMTLEMRYRELLEQGIEQGEMKKLITLICRKKRKSKTPEVIAEELEENLEQVKRIYDIADGFAPEYDVEKIYEELMTKSDQE